MFTLTQAASLTSLLKAQWKKAWAGKRRRVFIFQIYSVCARGS